MPAKVFSDNDADLTILQDKTLAVLGFGSQGHAHALNLKESGLKVIIGLYEGSKSIPVAKEKGFTHTVLGGWQVSGSPSRDEGRSHPGRAAASP